MFIHMTHDQPGLSEDQNRDVSTQLISIERRFVLHNETSWLFPAQRGIKRLGNQLRVVPAALDVFPQSGRRLTHTDILPGDASLVT
jgi:hypothetical protein